ncbi:MAG TPA: four helix bundle protein [Candidatus Paceibacterota bacterium]|jgi:four helix bundle protein|nr:four helix bundle protein [Candidatus Paceibacterota bacterium]
MMQAKSYKNLIVWQKSMQLVKEIYKLTDQMPHREVYGLADQMRRAAISVPSNIAEGSQRATRKDFSQFLRIARGSAAELETQLLLTKDLYPKINLQTAHELLDEIGRMLLALSRKLISPSKN